MGGECRADADAPPVPFHRKYRQVLFPKRKRDWKVFIEENGKNLVALSLLNRVEVHDERVVPGILLLLKPLTNLLQVVGRCLSDVVHCRTLNPSLSRAERES